MSSWSENWIYNLIPQEEYELAFDMVNGNLLNSPLQFECIHRGQKTATFVLGE